MLFREAQLAQLQTRVPEALKARQKVAQGVVRLGERSPGLSAILYLPAVPSVIRDRVERRARRRGQIP